MDKREKEIENKKKWTLEDDDDDDDQVNQISGNSVAGENGEVKKENGELKRENEEVKKEEKVEHKKVNEDDSDVDPLEAFMTMEVLPQVLPLINIIKTRFKVK